MAIPCTGGVFTRLSPDGFAGYSDIRYSAEDATHSVALGFTTSGTVDFSGNDTLDGGDGRDRLIGGSGDDLYDVDHAPDIIVEGPGGGTADRVLASTRFALAAEDRVETLTTKTVLRVGSTSSAIVSGNSLSAISVPRCCRVLAAMTRRTLASAPIR